MNKLFSTALSKVSGFIKSIGHSINDALFNFGVKSGFILCAVPMRSTDFRSIVEPILNEEFDGIYDQRADEWKQVFTERKGIPRNYH